MIAYYPFNGNAADGSGNSYNGTVVGSSLTDDRFGNSNSAYDFDGNDYIDLEERTVFDFNNYNSYSISVWVNPLNINNGVILSKI